MKYCKYCGNKLNENDRFCTKCGKALNVNVFSKLGDIWFIFLSGLNGISFVRDIHSIDKGMIYLFAAIISIAIIVACVKLLDTKKKKYFYLLVSCFICNGAITLYNDTVERSAAYLVGFIIGVLFDIAISYLACYKHLED